MTETTLSQRAADGRYWAADSRARDAHVALGQASDPRERATLLAKLAAAEREMANVHKAAFGPDWLEDDEMDLADSHGWSAEMLLALADVELAVANGTTQRHYTTLRIEPHVGEILDEMVRTPDLAARTALLERLADALTDVVGNQAAETLWCLPSPGYSGWLTTEQKDAWLAERGFPAGSQTFADQMTYRWVPLIRRYLVGLCVLTGALVLYFDWGRWFSMLGGAALIVAVPVWYAISTRRRAEFLDEDVDLEDAEPTDE